MTENSSEQCARRQVKRKNYFVCAAIILVSIFVDGWVIGSFAPVLVLTQLAWSASFVVLGVLIGAGRILAGGLTLGTALVLDVMADMPLQKMLPQVSSFFLLGVLAYTGSWTYRRMSIAEREAQQARLVALEQLARSEHQRVSTERQRTRELQEKNDALATALERLHATQRQLVTQEKLASLGSLTAGIAHELKNPLNFVKNFAETSREFIDDLMEEQAATKKDEVARADPLTLAMLRDNVGRIIEHSQRANRIIEGMLLHSRNAPASWTREELNTVIARSVELATHGLRARAPGMNIRIATRYDAQVGKVELVVNDMSRVIVNLIENAVYAVDQKLQAGDASYTPDISVHTRDLGQSVEIRIHDNGSGIPSHILDKVWNPFFTTKPPGEGTGLGLSISHDIITQGHKGQMRLESTEGEGTNIIITLPRNSSAQAIRQLAPGAAMREGGDPAGSSGARTSSRADGRTGRNGSSSTP